MIDSGGINLRLRKEARFMLRKVNSFDNYQMHGRAG
jgi:hypothetical protein